MVQSAQPIISYNYGSGSVGRVRAAFGLSLRVALLCGVVVCASIFILAPGIVSLFIPVDSEAGILAVGGLPVYSVCSVFFALNIAYIGYFQSIGAAMRAMLLTLLRGIVFLVPLFYILPHLWPGLGLWAAIPAAEVLTFLVILLTSRPTK